MYAFNNTFFFLINITFEENRGDREERKRDLKNTGVLRVRYFNILYEVYIFLFLFNNMNTWNNDKYNIIILRIIFFIIFKYAQYILRV